MDSMAGFYRSHYLIEQGFDIGTDANIFARASLMGLMWMFLFGFLGDKFPKRYLLAIAIALQSISVVVLMIEGYVAQLYLYSLIYRCGSGIIPLILAIRADYFGRKAFATITAVMGFASAIIYDVFTISSSLIFKLTENFQIAMVLSILVGFIAAVMFFFARPPEPLPQAFPNNKII
jgi:MFS family permease